MTRGADFFARRGSRPSALPCESRNGKYQRIAINPRPETHHREAPPLDGMRAFLVEMRAGARVLMDAATAAEIATIYEQDIPESLLRALKGGPL